MLNLKRPPYAVQRMSIAKYTNKEISMNYYNQDAVNIIKSYCAKP